MRKRNKVKKLQRTSAHRKAMLGNMVTSLLYHERIESTVAKTKATKILAEKLITRAKKGAQEDAKLHNLRQAARIVKDQEVLNKLFNDIAPRYTERPGGYTRIIRIGRRASDNSEMAILELVEKKEIAQIKDDRKTLRAALAEKSSKTVKTAKEAKPAKTAEKIAKTAEK